VLQNIVAVELCKIILLPSCAVCPPYFFVLENQLILLDYPTCSVGCNEYSNNCDCPLFTDTQIAEAPYLPNLTCSCASGWEGQYCSTGMPFLVVTAYADCYQL
jgi:hypothetical protein